MISARNRLVYPGGSARPGVNPNHVAFAGSGISQPLLHFSGIALPNGSFLRLDIVEVGSYTSGVLGFMHGNLGPCVYANTTSDQIVYSKVSDAVPSAWTYAAILTQPATSANSSMPISNGGSGFNHSQGILNSDGSAWEGYNNGGGFLGGGVGTGGVSVTGSPLFVVCSQATNGGQFVGIKNLVTGAYDSTTSTRTNGYTASTNITVLNGYTSSGFGFGPGNNANSYLAAACAIDGSYIGLQQFLVWAEAPWDFWYPPTVLEVLFSSLAAPPPPQEVVEAVSLADTVSAGVIYSVAVSESITLSDTPSSGAIFAVSVSESMTFADTAGPVSYDVTLAESISLVDTVNATRIHNANVAEALDLVDQSDSIWYPLIILFEADCVVSHTTDGKPSQPAVRFTRVDPTSLPREVEIQYSDLDEDYAVIPQSARQLYGRIKGGVPEVYAAASATQKMSVTSAFGIRANEAITLAYDMLYRLWTQTVQIEFEHSNLRFEAGDVFVLLGSFGRVIGRIDEAVWTKSRTNQIKATALSAVGPPLEADSGFPGLTPSSTTGGFPSVGTSTIKSQGPNLVGAQDNEPTKVAVEFSGGSG